VQVPFSGWLLLIGIETKTTGYYLACASSDAEFDGARVAGGLVVRASLWVFPRNAMFYELDSKSVQNTNSSKFFQFLSVSHMRYSNLIVGSLSSLTGRFKVVIS
jgi:hypothetical protein